MPAKYVRPYSKGQKNDFRDAEAIAEVVQWPTMKFVATKTADQIDLQALHACVNDWSASAPASSLATHGRDIHWVKRGSALTRQKSICL